MKAIVQDRYGLDALRLEDLDIPVAGGGDVVVRVRAAGVNPLDWHFARGVPRVARVSMGRPGPKPRVRGVDVAGRVETVGQNVKAFRPGDDVFGWCGGAFAEYASAPEDHFVTKPLNTPFDEAAAVPVAAVTALQGLRDFGKLKSGQRLLVNGASGGVGTFAVQIGKSFGAEVTGVCSSRNVELVKSLGADHVLDYNNEDFTQSGVHYDVILDNAGNHPLSSLRRTLSAGGTLVYNSGASMGRIVMAQLLSRIGTNVSSFLARLNHDDLVIIQALMESGKLRSVIDRTYPLAETAAAIAYVEAGHARGKVVVKV
ncbi:MAG TPA: NAD(P)-dependent alcohol dehydrogenase [Candidatus Dormibacteraeota bacterium]|nr:NAD(P)-dependent alcohol dehydrogenase [Candidatus Dormibacteraeota bacterium]